MKKLYFGDAKNLCRRSGVNFARSFSTAQAIIADVKDRGDSALFDYAKKFDYADLQMLEVSDEEIAKATKSIPDETKKAFESAASNIEKFHSLKLLGRQSVETMKGVKCFVESRGIEKIGIYIPGGTAPLPSTVLMLGIPAKIAGCKDVIMCTPPNSKGEVPNIILFAAQICGIKRIFKIGGAQAIAAMAYGTKSVPKVYKIFGPGNSYVTAAKMLVSIDPEGAGIDMPAGPSEVLVIADRYARPEFVASDLLSQAEHGEDSQAVLVCTDDNNAEMIIGEVNRQIKTLKRKEIAMKAIKNSFALIVEDIEEALEFANKYAPEHLILNVENPNEYISKIINAGSVFLGQYSCESAGDYASGTNHTLPTYGYSKAYSGVSVSSFQKSITFQEITKQGAKALCPIVSQMARQEGLDAHEKAMEIRLTTNL
ncbi:MAG: hypothetical protein ACD_51C00028G0016 [uncultured bacterium]|nr:MAG: hypothetical protein ACD_51C00028G0016 [uncultured bacterium]OGJ47880.1 MAG: histidinol dehydrogenase [Candidatus Peregrinibacteria bacterium RIFOXYA2_FULL_41_18]OGJ49141.1 MAG: histidinol dehydrogenase [Candidatus Peregrinibacteria bacterium RIFOXYB12_FULL_41_12]OGJ53303.1 MAG: histidinol dehydrogenase [Candidatus Peregrinibacteria bacterium RIFOXYC2_FULL_41_22]